MKYEIKLNTARNALRYIIRAYKIKKIFIPYYICPSVKTAIRKENIEIKYYKIDKNFAPITSFLENDFILYPNYFGICSNIIQTLEKKYKNLIIDNSQAFYSKPYGIASFNSIRKFFYKEYKIKDGSILYTNFKLEDNFNYGENYILDKNYSYKNIVENENRLDKEDILLMSKTSENELSKINFQYEKERRIQKFLYFNSQYKNKNELIFNLSNEDIPFVYPYYTKDSNEGFRLEKEGLLIYRYWQNLPKKFDEYNFYKYLIPIPLD